MVAHNDLLRVIELQGTVAQLVARGKRDASQVAAVLQVINDHEDFTIRLGFASKTAVFALGTVDDQLASWAAFYQKHGIAVDLSNLCMPERKPGFDRLIIVPKGMTPNRAYELCEKCFVCWRYPNDLDSAIVENDRAPTETYALWCRDRIEADEELRNRSANDLAQESIPGITLLERLLFEAKFFHETGTHLDLKNWTLCSGSRGSDGSVPRVVWRPVDLRLDVGWAYSRDRFGYLRARAVLA